MIEDYSLYRYTIQYPFHLNCLWKEDYGDGNRDATAARSHPTLPNSLSAGSIQVVLVECNVSKKWRGKAKDEHAVHLSDLQRLS